MSGTMLKDKVILVTGAGRGIGRDISLLAASQGAKVVVNDIGGTPKGEGADRTPAMEVVAEIIDAGGEAVANYDSVADFDAAHNMVEQATSTFGRLDGVVNNAGILRDVIFHKMTEEDFDSVISVHLKGTVNVSRAAATVFRQQGSGAFVHMTSTSGLIGNFGQVNYGAAKLGIAGYRSAWRWTCHVLAYAQIAFRPSHGPA
jgi:NAD(P)-dependent dehydrogenase (short-subunit alcohol dehydrogenase family)